MEKERTLRDAKPPKPPGRSGIFPRRAQKAAGSTAAFRQAFHKRLIERKSEKSLAFIVERAAEVLGGKHVAMQWLGTPIRALDFATPVSLLGTKAGIVRVSDILGQMEHGIW